MSTDGPYLYDDDPAPLHTGTPRPANRLILVLLFGTILVAIGSIVAMYLVRGTADERAQEVVGVFVAALEAGDTETAHELLCADEQARLEPDEVADEYLGEGPGEIGGVRDERGSGAKYVVVRWADGSASEIRATADDGRRICGVTG